MDRSDIVTLVSSTLTQNSIGAWVANETTTDVYCKTDSVSREEFFSAGRTGLNPEYRFTLFACDYNGEKTVVYKGMRYGICRTYHATTDRMELYGGRKGGAVDAIVQN